MAAKVLLLEPSLLHAQSLKSRLESMGAECILITHAKDIANVADQGWDLAVVEAALPDSSSLEHLKILKALGKPVFLWTDEPALGGDLASLKLLGVAKVFRKLNRADLVLEAEKILGLGQPVAPVLSRRFLVVEDSVTVRNYVRKVLADRFPGSEVSEADDGKTAISAMKSGRVDLIVTDLQMPGMDGQAFVQVLRGNAVLARKPIIVLSGMITAKVREDMAGMPRLRLLAKPASPEALEEAVKALLAEPMTVGA